MSNHLHIAQSHLKSPANCPITPQNTCPLTNHISNHLPFMMAGAFKAVSFILLNNRRIIKLDGLQIIENEGDRLKSTSHYTQRPITSQITY
jgi:hypothetical protein